MYKTIILPLAKQDINGAALWYNAKQAGLGKRFTTQVREKISFITQNPYTIATRYEEVKTILLDIFPYMIHYIVDEPNTTIIVTAVLHTSRNPNIWKMDRDQ